MNSFLEMKISLCYLHCGTFVITKIHSKNIHVDFFTSNTFQYALKQTKKNIYLKRFIFHIILYSLNDYLLFDEKYIRNHFPLSLKLMLLISSKILVFHFLNYFYFIHHGFKLINLVQSFCQNNGNGQRFSFTLVSFLLQFCLLPK